MILKKPMSIYELKNIASEYFGDMVKAVIDIDQGIIAISSELHSDLEQELLANGSIQEFLWGINLYPEYFGSEDFVEFDSLINIRPWKNNRSRYIEDENVRNKIYGIVKSYFNDAA